MPDFQETKYNFNLVKGSQPSILWISESVQSCLLDLKAFEGYNSLVYNQLTN